MNKKVNYSKWLGIAIVVLFLAVGAFMLKSRADTPETSLEVLGTPPNTPSEVAEYVAGDYHAGNASDKVSTSEYPTNVGTEITFVAVATDDNDDNWKLAICKDGTVPTVGAGPEYTISCSAPENQICVSTEWTASGEEDMSCKYTPDPEDSISGSAESVAWYAYACDETGCSDDVTNQGKEMAIGGDSPFYVNHRPTLANGTAPVADPGAKSTFLSDGDDTDVNGTEDTVSLYVCKTNDFTGDSDTPGCTGGAENTWCSSTGSSGSPSCDMLGLPIQDALYNAYPFIVDSHGFPALGGDQGVNNQAEVSNLAPVVIDTSLGLFDPKDDGVTNGDETAFDGTPSLTLTNQLGQSGGTTTGFKVKFSATDPNGCLNSSSGNEVSSGIAAVYRSSVSGGSSCTEDDDNCYKTAVCSQDENTCSGVSDTDTTWTCTVNIKYHADPTTAGSKYPDDYWYASARLTDDDSLNGSTTDMAGASQGNEMEQFMAYGVNESAVAYKVGLLGVAPGQTSDSAPTTLLGKGNTGLYSIVSTAKNGLDDLPFMCTDYPDCSGKLTGNTGPEYAIAAAQQKYNASTGFAWDDETTNILSATSTDFLNYCVKPITSSANPSKVTYWKLKVPNTQKAGIYTGLNEILGAVSSSPDTNW